MFIDILKNREITEASGSISKIRGTDIVCKISDGKKYNGPYGPEAELVQKWYYDGDIAIIVVISNVSDVRVKVMDEEMLGYLMNELLTIGV